MLSLPKRFNNNDKQIFRQAQDDMLYDLTSTSL